MEAVALARGFSELQLWETPATFYLFGRSPERSRAWSLLKGLVFVLHACAFLGMVRFLESYYLHFATRREHVGLIGARSVYRIDATTLVPTAPPAELAQRLSAVLPPPSATLQRERERLERTPSAGVAGSGAASSAGAGPPAAADPAQAAAVWREARPHQAALAAARRWPSWPFERFAEQLGRTTGPVGAGVGPGASSDSLGGAVLPLGTADEAERPLAGSSGGGRRESGGSSGSARGNRRPAWLRVPLAAANQLGRLTAELQAGWAASAACRQLLESRYRTLFASMDLSKDCFYAHDYDLTRSLQHNCARERARARAAPGLAGGAGERAADAPKERFVWNRFLIIECERALGVEAMACWLTPVVHGFFAQTCA
ncbi:SAC domain-containing protein [Pavlovales sp. CCMP2436]|nr:SAC domain-containing protein [Pavlovales sp. CCMP2436]